MNKKTRIIIGLLSSFFLFSVGTYQILIDTISSNSLFVSYDFAITGFIGTIGNAVRLKKAQSNSDYRKA